MTRYDVVELELDDLTYRMTYSYSPVRPATRWEPQEGGLEIETVEVILRGGVVLPVLDYDRLADLPELLERAEAQEREKRDVA